MGVMPGARYRVADEQAAPVEERLPVCEERRARLTGWDAYVRGYACGDAVIIQEFPQNLKDR
jgi:hypothetical protein